MTAYDNAVLADSPLFYIPMNERSGTTFNDMSGNGRNFTAQNLTFAQAALFPDGDASVTVGNSGADEAWCNHASWMDITSFSFDCWVKLTDVTSRHAVAARDWSSPRLWTLYVTGGKLSIFDSAGTDHTGTATLSTGTAYHVGFSYDSSTTTARTFVNGVLDGTFTITLNNVQASTYFSIGVSPAGTTSTPGGTLFFPLNGNISNCAYYTGRLADARFAAHNSAGAAKKLQGWGQPAFAA